LRRNYLPSGIFLRMATMMVIVAVMIAAAPWVAQGSEVDAEVALRGDDNALDINAHARVQGTFGLGLAIREGPGATYLTRATLPDGTRLQVETGPRQDREGRDWYLVSTLAQPRVRGWSASDYLLPIDPNEPEPTPVVVRPTPVPVAAASGNGGRSFTAKLTGYTYQVPGNGAHGSITKSGTTVHWGTVAVDPSVIPLGTRLMIEGYDTVFIAEDTGYGVRGNHVDVFFDDYDTAIRFGVQFRNVTILN
jgi:3D (Asp-Asp-Asp) domain-containing protein